MAKKLQLRIITPDAVKVDEPVDMVIMRTSTGDMGILPGREPVSAVLYIGTMRIIADNEERLIAVYGGIAQIQNDEVLIICNGAQWPEEIERDAAHAEHSEAESRLRNAQDKAQIQRDQFAMRRALVQIEVSSYPILGAGKK